MVLGGFILNKVDWIAAAVEGQATQLLPFEIPTFYVSKELLSAAARTDLPTDIFWATQGTLGYDPISTKGSKSIAIHA